MPAPATPVAPPRAAPALTAVDSVDEARDLWGAGQREEALARLEAADGTAAAGDSLHRRTAAQMCLEAGDYAGVLRHADAALAIARTTGGLYYRALGLAAGREAWHLDAETAGVVQALLLEAVGLPGASPVVFAYAADVCGPPAYRDPAPDDPDVATRRAILDRAVAAHPDDPALLLSRAELEPGPFDALGPDDPALLAVYLTRGGSFERPAPPAGAPPTGGTSDSASDGASGQDAALAEVGGLAPALAAWLLPLLAADRAAPAAGSLSRPLTRPLAEHERERLAALLFRHRRPALGLEVLDRLGPIRVPAVARADAGAYRDAVALANRAAADDLARARACLHLSRWSEARAAYEAVAAAPLAVPADAPDAAPEDVPDDVPSAPAPDVAYPLLAAAGLAVLLAIRAAREPAAAVEAAAATRRVLDLWYAAGCPSYLAAYDWMAVRPVPAAARTLELRLLGEFATDPSLQAALGDADAGRLTWLRVVERAPYGELADLPTHWYAYVEAAARLAPSPLHHGRLVDFYCASNRYADAVALALRDAAENRWWREGLLAPTPALAGAHREAVGAAEALGGLPATEDLDDAAVRAVHDGALAGVRGLTDALAAWAGGTGAVDGAPAAPDTWGRALEAAYAACDAWYRSHWRLALLGRRWYAELREAALAMADLGHLVVGALPFFDCAYALAALGERAGAAAMYRAALAVDDAFAAAHHNLALLYEHDEQYGEALAHVGRAHALDPTPAREQWLARLEAAHRAAERARARAEEFERTAPTRWAQVEGPGRSVLAVFTQIDQFDDFDHLGRLAGMGREWAERHYKKLVKLGMLLVERDGRWRVNPHVLPLIERERSHAVAATLVRADERILYKPIFNSRTEYTVYQVLTQLFPNHLVFPNVALSTVFQYDRLKAALDYETFGYFLRAHLDFCVVHAGSYYPILAFEVDSDWHDDPKQQARDERKNAICQLGGVPLLRLRPFGRPGPEAVRQDVARAVASCDQLLATNSKLVARLGDLDLDAFLALARGAEPEGGSETGQDGWTPPGPGALESGAGRPDVPAPPGPSPARGRRRRRIREGGSGPAPDAAGAPPLRLVRTDASQRP